MGPSRLIESTTAAVVEKAGAGSPFSSICGDDFASTGSRCFSASECDSLAFPADEEAESKVARSEEDAMSRPVRRANLTAIVSETMPVHERGGWAAQMVGEPVEPGRLARGWLGELETTLQTR